MKGYLKQPLLTTIIHQTLLWCSEKKEEGRKRLGNDVLLRFMDRTGAHKTTQNTTMITTTHDGE